MREALTRRCARIVAGEYPGARPAGDRRRQGQVGGRRRGAGRAGAARRAADRHRQGPGAQGRARRTSCSRTATTLLNLPPDHPGLHLLQQIRDEAHRFAIQGHRARRAKARTTSSLQEIAGIGAAQAAGAARALRRPQGRAGGERRRPRARAGDQPRARRAHLRRSCTDGAGRDAATAPAVRHRADGGTSTLDASAPCADDGPQHSRLHSPGCGSC